MIQSQPCLTGTLWACFGTFRKVTCQPAATGCWDECFCTVNSLAALTQHNKTDSVHVRITFHYPPRTIVPSVGLKRAAHSSRSSRKPSALNGWVKWCYQSWPNHTACKLSNAWRCLSGRLSHYLVPANTLSWFRRVWKQSGIRCCTPRKCFKMSGMGEVFALSIGDLALF